MSTLRLNGDPVTLNGVIVTLNGPDVVVPPVGAPPATLIWPAVWLAPRVIAASVGPEVWPATWPAPRVIAASIGPLVWPATVEDRVIPGTWRAD